VSALTKALGTVAALVMLAACANATRLSPEDDRAYEVSAAWIGGAPAVAWYGGRLSHEAVYLRFTDPRGRPVASPLQLTDASRDAFEPSLQELDGHALVAWYEQAAGPPGTTRRQWSLLARFDLAGRRIWQRQLSSDEASGRIPVVRVAGGIIHVAWLEQRGEALPVLRAATLDGAGNWLSAPRDVLTVGRTTWNLNATVGPDGSFHVVLDSGPGSRANELHWLRMQGEEATGMRISRDDGSDSSYPDIAIHDATAAITWFDSRDGNPEVYLRCIPLAGDGAPPSNLRLDDAALRVTRTATESIGAYLAWRDDVIELAWTEGSGKRRELWHQRFDRECRPRTAARRVAGRAGQAGIASLASSPAGFALAWNAQRGSGPTSSSVVLLKVWPRREVSLTAAAR
jgi:hypothetical protein